MLRENSDGEVLQAVVIVVGSGSKGKGREIHPVSVKVGDKFFSQNMEAQSRSR